MASNKVGTLIKEARTNADLTQEQLARRIDGLSASDISLAERGQKELTQAQLKQIAKVTGVTQASLINAARDASSAKGTASRSTAAKGSTAKSTSAKSTTAKSTAAKSTTAKTATSKKTATAGKSGASSSTQSSMKVTVAERKLVELFREADAETRKQAMRLLKGEDDGSNSLIGDILETVQGLLENR